MKLNFICIFILLIHLIIFINTKSSLHSIYSTNANFSKLKMNQPFKTVQKYKFLFMLKWPSVKNEKTHPLNILSYKNVLLSTSQVVYFVSQNPASSVSK